MSTLVMVERAGVACMAADTLTSFGSRKQSERYAEKSEKILELDGTYIGFVGWCVHQDVLESVFARGLKLPEIRTKQDLFEFSRVLHLQLKDKYFLNTTEDEDDPYESSQMKLFVLNRHGMFGLYSMRSVEHHRCFAATGSGAHYALGAMYAAYERGLPAEDVARLGVEAGIEFDCYSMGPITLRRIDCATEQGTQSSESLLATA